MLFHFFHFLHTIKDALGEAEGDDRAEEDKDADAERDAQLARAKTAREDEIQAGTRNRTRDETTAQQARVRSSLDRDR